MQSAITGNYIIFRSCGQQSKRLDKNKSRIRNNQVQVLRSTPDDEEILISSVDTMTLQAIDPVEVQQGTDWLDVDEAALVCSMSSSSQTNPLNNHQSQAQENTDFSPLPPDYKLIEAQQVISNFPYIKNYEFDHAYILHHLEQLEIDPTLCSKCSVANKYFASPKPFLQDLYKKSCHWKHVLGTKNIFDINPYVELT